jgi:tRNA threonylcarbamoyladenosine biosynthesis protein TsaE
VRELSLRSSSPADTKAIGAAIADVMREGDVVALTGELGAGKTCLVQGAAGALGVTERVTSPSFILRKDYAGRVPVLHLDVYRLETLQDVVELGWDEALDRTRIAFVEWGDAMSPLLPLDHLEVELRVIEDDARPPGDEDRRLVLRARGEDWSRRLEDVARQAEQWREET